jgi:hypothetical protein
MDKLKITFGIITTENTQHYIKDIIESIKLQNIPEDSYEIIIVGNCNIPDEKNVRIITFDESIKNMWITKKKNIITKEAIYENIVYMHDYLSLSSEWYIKFLEFGTEWDICMNSIKNPDGSRILDWMGLPDDPIYGNVVLPYEYAGSKGMYVPGYFWIAKKSIMLEYPLNEDFCWGEGEDIEWSKRAIGGFPPGWLKNSTDLLSGRVKIGDSKYVINQECSIISLKHKFFHPDFFTGNDLHSGNESRPLESTIENYKYLKYRTH